MKIHFIIFLIIATQYQFASANMCDDTLEDAKKSMMGIDQDILDTGLLIPKKIEYTSRCIKNQQYNTQCQHKIEFQDKFIFDEDGRLITKISSVDTRYAGKLDFNYDGDSKYPIEIINDSKETTVIKRDSDNLPTAIAHRKTEFRKWTKRDGYVIADYEPIASPLMTFPGVIKFYKDNIITKATIYNKNNASTIDITCRRYEDENWNDIIDEVRKVDGISKVKHRTARHKNGYIVFKLSYHDNAKNTPTPTGTSFKYKKFDEGANWTLREICQHNSSWEKFESCEEQLRSIEYKVPPKK